MTIHFVYPHDDKRIAAPWSIGNHVAAGLRVAGHDVIQYDWTDTATIASADGDVLLGHPHPADGFVFRNSLNGRWRRKVALAPFNGSNANLCFVDSWMRDVDRFLAICGPLWAAKLPVLWPATSLDMAIDPQHFQRLTAFAPVGRRAIGYIGCCVPDKGIDYLRKIAPLLGSKIYHFGPDKIGPEVVECGNHDFRRGCPVMDFVINCGVNDANPTTVLEAACWGMLAFCTPGSGWGEDVAIHIPAGDAQGAAAIINKWLAAPIEELEARRAAVDSVLPRYSWEVFVSKVLEAVS